MLQTSISLTIFNPEITCACRILVVNYKISDDYVRINHNLAVSHFLHLKYSVKQYILVNKEKEQ